MKAVVIKQTGPSSVLEWVDLEVPTPGPGQVLIQVGAVSVNPIDTYIRSGMIAMELPNPFIVGCDVAGRVAGVGPGVHQFKEGDRVWGSNQGLLGRQGTFAEFIVVDETWLYSTPGNVQDEEAAAMALVGITAHLGLVFHANLKAGETLFVNGGSGGVGSTVIQMARALGARVLTSAGSEERCRACIHLGAEEAFNYKDTPIAEALKSRLDGGVNVWWETTREPDFDLIVGSLASFGRVVLMAGREARPEFPVGPFYVKNCSMHGFAMFLAPADRQRQCAEDINKWMSQGLIKPRIAEVLPLSEAARAHQLQEENTLQGAGTISGKIVLKP